MSQERPTPEFDPYYRWLGIRDARRPPNHYRLLGLELFETDAEVISAAADRQMAHIRGYANGPHGVLSQHVLNEISAAKICLLHPNRRALYDDQLRADLAAAAAPLPGAASPAPTAAPSAVPAAPLSPSSFTSASASAAAPPPMIPTIPAPPATSPLFPGAAAPRAASEAAVGGPSFAGFPPADYGAAAAQGVAPAGLQVDDGVRRHGGPVGWKALKGRLGVMWGTVLVAAILLLLANRTRSPAVPVAGGPSASGSAAGGSAAGTALLSAPGGGAADPLAPRRVGGSEGEPAAAVEAPAEKLVETSPSWKVHDGSVWQASATPDGKMMITAGTDNLAKLFHLPDGKLFRELKKHQTYVQAAAATRSGGRFATASLDGQLYIWDPTQSEPVGAIEVGDVPVRALAFSHDGAKLAGGDEAGGLHVWNVADASVLATYENVLPSKILALAFLEEDHLLVAGEDPIVRLIDVASGAPVREFRGHKSIVYGLAHPSEGKRFATVGADGLLCLWSSDQRTPLKKITIPAKALRAVALSPDGRQAAVGGDDAVVRVWDLASGRETAYSNRLAGNVRSLFYSNAGDVLYSAGTEANVHRFTPPKSAGGEGAPSAPPEADPLDAPAKGGPTDKPADPPQTEEKKEAASPTS